jgi:hypothetical protein
MNKKTQDCCPCAYCDFFEPFEYENKHFKIYKGLCEKHNIIRNPDDTLCEDFILMSGVYTKKWYPNK